MPFLLLAEKGAVQKIADVVGKIEEKIEEIVDDNVLDYCSLDKLVGQSPSLCQADAPSTVYYVIAPPKFPVS